MPNRHPLRPYGVSLPGLDVLMGWNGTRLWGARQPRIKGLAARQRMLMGWATFCVVLSCTP
jgi:hypothetical protein